MCCRPLILPPDAKYTTRAVFQCFCNFEYCGSFKVCLVVFSDHLWKNKEAGTVFGQENVKNVKNSTKFHHETRDSRVVEFLALKSTRPQKSKNQVWSLPRQTGLETSNVPSVKVMVSARAQGSFSSRVLTSLEKTGGERDHSQTQRFFVFYRP